MAEYLEKIWEVVGRAALRQILGSDGARNGGAAAMEEDARLTALFLWTLQSTAQESAVATSDGEDDAAEEGYEEDEEQSASKKPKGYTLVFDIVRRFAQPLGIRLPDWEGRTIETKKGVVRLLPVPERAKQLFGQEGAHAVAERLETATAVSPQQFLFPEMNPLQEGSRRGRAGRALIEASDETLTTRREATTLDRVHAAMLLQASGRASALRNLLRAEQQRGPEFLRLADALSALYPKESEEKRLLDAMLLAVPR